MKVLDMTKTNDALSKALNTVYDSKKSASEGMDKAFGGQVQAQKVEVLPSKQISDEVEDYDLARSTMHSLLMNGNDALSGILELAKDSEHPRAYEVVATLIKTLSDTSKDLYHIQEASRKIREMDDPERYNKKSDGSKINVEKAVFVGTPADRLKMLENNDDTIDQ